MNSTASAEPLTHAEIMSVGGESSVCNPRSVRKAR